MTEGPIDIEFSGAVEPETEEIVVNGSFLGQDGKPGVLKAPFNIPIKIQDPSFSMSLFAGEVVTQFGIAGKFKFGSKEAFVDTQIDAEDPIHNYFSFKLNKACIMDHITFMYDLVATNLPIPQVPNIFCLEDVTAQWTYLPVTLRDGTVLQPGITLKGDINLGVPGIPKGTVNLMLDPFKLTMCGCGALNDKINLGGIVKISDASGKNPPSLGMQFSGTGASVCNCVSEGGKSTAQQPEGHLAVWVDGYANIAGLLKEQTKAYFTEKGITVALVTKKFGIGSTLTVTFPFSDPSNSFFKYELSAQELAEYVKEDLSKNVDDAKNTINKFGDDADKAINDAQDKCGDLEVLSDICKAPLQLASETIKLLKTVINQSLAGIDTIAREINDNFHFNYVSISGNAAAFKGEGDLVSVAFSFVVLGKEIATTISIPNPKDIGNFVADIAKIVYEKAMKDPFNQFINQAKEAFDKVTSFLDDIGDAIMGVFDDVAQVAKDVAKEVAGFAKDVANFAVDIGNTFKNIGTQVGGAIKDFTLDAGNKIANFATDAVGQIGNAVNDATNKVVDIANDIGDIGQTVINEIGNAFKTAGNAIKEGFEKVGEVLNPTNW